MISGLNGLILITENFDEQIEFYETTMGFTVKCKYHDAVFFEVGTQVFALFNRGHHPEGDERLNGAAHGISHIEFNVEPENRELMENKLQSKGAHAYKDNFQDADGNIFHFVTTKD